MILVVAFASFLQLTYLSIDVSGVTCGLNFELTGMNLSNHNILTHRVTRLKKKGGGRIINGEEAMRNEFPWNICIQAYIDDHWRVNCGGSILDEWTILTAAHCKYVSYKEDTSIEVRVVAGCRRPFGDDVETRCQVIYYDYTDVIRHPKYIRNRQNDVAIIKLKTPLKFTNTYDAAVGPICLVPFNIPYQGMAAVAGWGKATTKTFSKNIWPQYLRVVDINILPDEYCVRNTSAYTGYARYNPDKEICAAYKKGERDSCEGDSGGPLMITKGGQVIEIGIVSYGFHCAAVGFPGVYVRINRYVAWIKSFMRNKDLLMQIKDRL